MTGIEKNYMHICWTWDWVSISILPLKSAIFRNDVPLKEAAKVMT